MMFGKLYCCLSAFLSWTIFARQPAVRDHAIDLDQQLLVVPGLGEIIVRAVLERGHRHFHRPVGGDHEDRRLGVALADLAQHFHAGAVRHHQIQQDHVVVGGFGAAQAFAAVLRQLHRVAFQAQQRLQAFADVRFVVDY